jgi:hypothetical protein
MAARGSIAKTEITQKILEVFQGSFINDKEIRIPFHENGEDIEIKCVLTCAKTNVREGGSMPSFPAPETPVASSSAFGSFSTDSTITAPTEEEINKVKDLVAKFNL